MKYFLALLCMIVPLLLMCSLPARAQGLSTGVGLSAQGSRLIKLGQLLGANFNSTSDQAIAISGTSKYIVSEVVVTNCSTSITTAQGAFYEAASKTTPLFNTITTTPYTAATSATVALMLGGGSATGAASSGVTAIYTAAGTIYLSLTTGQGGAATCDVYVLGEDLS